MFAIIETGGKQYKVKKGQILEIEKIDEASGSDKTIIFEKILLTSDGENTKIGSPYIQNSKVNGKILEQTKGDKIRVFKMKPKKRYQKTQGHRQSLTKIEITEIK